MIEDKTPIIRRHMMEFVSKHPRKDLMTAYKILAQIGAQRARDEGVRASDVASILGLEKKVIDSTIRSMRELDVGYITVLSHGEGRMRLNVEDDPETYWYPGAYIPVMEEHMEQLKERVREEEGLEKIIKKPFKEMLGHLNEGRVEYAIRYYEKVVELLDKNGLKGDLKQLYYRGTANHYGLTEKGEVVCDRINEEFQRSPVPS